MNKFTKEEDGVIIREVKNSPNNLALAFKNASKEINRSYYGIHQRWYKYLRKSETCYVLVGNKAYKNTKIAKNNSSKECSSKKLFNKLIKWLHFK